MKAHFLNRIVLVLVAAALAVPVAQAAAPRYDGYKSSYPQLHELRSGATIPDPDYKSSYPQLHLVATHQVAAPVTLTRGGGFDWRDAGIGVLVGALAAGLVAVSVWQLRRDRVAALQ